MPESRIIWLRVNTQMRQTQPFKVTNTQLLLQDEFLNLDDLTELDDATIFKLEKLSTQPYERDSWTAFDVTVEMNLDQVVIARQGYTVLDFFSDIGGMQSILMSGAAFFIYAWTYNNLDDYMVTKLYRVAQKNDANQPAVDHEQAPDSPDDPPSPPVSYA